MAQYIRTNGSQVFERNTASNISGATTSTVIGNYIQGTIQYTAQNVRAFLVNFGEPLTDKDGDAAGEIDQSIEVAMKIVQPLVYYSASTSNTVSVITDISGVTASDLQTRLQAQGNVLLTNGWANLAAVTVTAATSLTAA